MEVERLCSLFFSPMGIPDNVQCCVGTRGSGWTVEQLIVNETLITGRGGVRDLMTR